MGVNLSLDLESIREQFAIARFLKSTLPRGRGKNCLASTGSFVAARPTVLVEDVLGTVEMASL
jgi:hypothetical protein